MTKQRGDAPHFLHLQSTFDAGGKEVRTTQIINALGRRARHTIVSAMPENLAAAERIDRSVDLTLQPDFPSLQGSPWLGRLLRLARAMQGYDLILTYNWGAMDAVLAHTLYGEYLGLAPLIHHEDGFDESETHRLKRRRNWFRRIALGRTARLIVPSETLEEIALTAWQQPFGRVVRIPNGIDTAAFAKPPNRAAIPLPLVPDRRWVATFAGLRAVKNLPRLVQAFAKLPEDWHLAIFGEGPERAAIEAAAAQAGVAERVHLPGAVRDPAAMLGAFDIFALSSDSEQFPLSVVEAMAAGLPVAAPAVGDVPQIVAPENADYIVAPGDSDALTAALVELAGDAEARRSIGAANRARARSQYDAETMLAAHRRLYENVMRRSL